jgi:uncharacterized Rmd1/YagE family protein
VIYTPFVLGTSPGIQEASVGIDFFAPQSTTPTSTAYPTSSKPNVNDPGSSHTDPFFLQNIDSFGQEIPANVPFGSLAKRIAPAGECLFFDYGVVVLWGLTEAEEKKMLEYLHAFEEETLDSDDIETEEFHFHYNAFCQPRIYNDVITLKVFISLSVHVYTLALQSNAKRI